MKLFLPYARFDDHDIHWESSQTEGKVYYDVVFYQGPDRDFNLGSMQRAAAAVALCMDPQYAQAPTIEIRHKDNRLHLQWKELELDFPTKPAPRKELHAPPQ